LMFRDVPRRSTIRLRVHSGQIPPKPTRPRNLRNTQNDKCSRRVSGEPLTGAQEGCLVLGGIISGEDPHGFVTEIRAVLADSRLALLLSLYAEAKAEEDLDFAYFSYWGLLELASIKAGSIGEKRPSVEGSGTLWNATGVWYGRRNATAHYGGFRPGIRRNLGTPTLEPHTSWRISTVVMTDSTITASNGSGTPPRSFSTGSYSASRCIPRRLLSQHANL
jgi:hypothetical protein